MAQASNYLQAIQGRGGVQTNNIPVQSSIQSLQNQNITKQSPSAKNLFSDEQEKYNQMVSDGLDDTVARQLIAKKRQTLLKDITTDEAKALLKMQNDGLDSETAVKVVKENRYTNLPLYKKALKIPFDASVGATALATEQVGNILDFVTGGQVPYFKEQVEGVKEVTGRSFEDSTAYQAGRKIFGTGEMIATGPTKIKPTLAGRTAQGAMVGGLFGAGMPVLEKGADVTPGEIIKGGVAGATLGAVATPVLEKAVIPALGKTIEKGAKYTKALTKGGVKGLRTSVTRDITRPLKTIKTKGIAPKVAYQQSTKANRFNAKDIEDFKKITGETPGEWAVKRGVTSIGDDAVDDATKLYLKSMNEADEALAMIDGRYKIHKGTDYMGEMLDDLSKRLSKTLSKDARKVNLLNKKYNTQGLTMSEINDIKRLYSRNYKYTWVDAGSESALRSKNLQDGVRKWQFKTAKSQGLQNLAEINKTTQGWKTFADNLAKKLKRSSGNNNLSLTDWIALSGGEPTNIALFLGKKVGEFAPVKKAIIKGLGKQTKPSIIKADIRAPRIKGLLPEKAGIGIKGPIITPQTIEKGIIQESKLPLKQTKYGTTNNIPSSRTTSRFTVDKGLKKKEVAEGLTKKSTKTAQAISSKKAFIAPTEIKKDIVKLKDNIKQSTNKNIVFHGTNAEFDKFAKEMIGRGATSKFGKGVYLSSSPEVAKTYADLMAGLKGGKARLIEAVIPDNMNIKTYNGPITGLKEASTKAKAEGYKGIKFNAERDFIQIPGLRKIETTGHHNYLIFNPDDAKIIKNYAIKELGLVKGMGLLRDLMAGGVVGLSGVQVGLMTPDIIKKLKEIFSKKEDRAKIEEWFAPRG